MLDISKIIIKEVRYADHNKYEKRFDSHEEIIKKDVEFLLSNGILLSKSDILSVVDVDDKDEFVHYQVIDRQFITYDDIINIIYYFDDL
jgi:hypothetical protein